MALPSTFNIAQAITSSLFRKIYRYVKSITKPIICFVAPFACLNDPFQVTKSVSLVKITFDAMIREKRQDTDFFDKYHCLTIFSQAKQRVYYGVVDAVFVLIQNCYISIIFSISRRDCEDILNEGRRRGENTKESGWYLVKNNADGTLRSIYCDFPSPSKGQYVSATL